MNNRKVYARDGKSWIMNLWYGSSFALLILVSVIAPGCIYQDSYLPQPETLSDAKKSAYQEVDPGFFLKNPDEYTDNYILLRGKVSWISYEGGKTALIINPQPYNNEPVSVNYKGRVPEGYMGTNVAVYGVSKGRDTIKNTNTGEDMQVPRIDAVQIIPAWIDEPVTSTTSNLILVAESKSLVTGESWDMGSGYVLIVMALDDKASPKQVWVALERDGKKLDDKILTEGEVYTFRDMVSFKVYSIAIENLVLKNVRIAS